MTTKPVGGVETHPVQLSGHRCGKCPTVVTLLAYEVYCAVYSPQQALVIGDCRGGFGANELVAYLYARSFPRSEWTKRVAEAFEGMEL